MKLKKIVSAVMAGVVAVTTAISGLSLSAGAVSAKVTASGSGFNISYIPEIMNKNSKNYSEFLKEYYGDYEGLIETGKNEYLIIAGLDENDIITITVRFNGKEESLQMERSVGSYYGYHYTYESGTSVKEILDTEQCTLDELNIRFCDPNNILNGVDSFEYEITITPGSTSSSSANKKTGDTNGDGSINALDAAAILKAVVNGTAISTQAGDFNGDGKVNALDSAAILKYVVNG